MSISLFRSVANQYQGLRSVTTVSMMNTISRLIEDQVINHTMPVNFYAGFERFSNFPAQLRRYGRLGATCRRVYVFGVADVRPPSIPGVEFIDIAISSPLAREWFLLVDTPDFWATLLTQEVDGQDAIRGGRQFDGIWSFDEQIVDRASLLLSQEMGLPYTPVVKRNYTSQMTNVAEINSNMVGLLENTRLVGHRRWKRIATTQKVVELALKNQPLNATLAEVAGTLHTIFGASDVAIVLADAKNNFSVASVTGAAVAGIVDQAGNGPIAQAIMQRRAVKVLDTRQSRMREPALPSALSVYAAPILGKSAIYGVVAIGSPDAQQWSDEDSDMLTAVAHALSSIIDRSRLQKVLLDMTRKQNTPA
ncbi:MAG: GAF domain-containing protein [Chloroflexales bacterium]|nr:GAF domain-containing protein [Chloroflexales bacterium]